MPVDDITSLGRTPGGWDIKRLVSKQNPPT